MTSKGKTTCNRTACQKQLTLVDTYYNKTMSANYCKECADLINDYNSNFLLCVPTDKNVLILEVEHLFQEITDMHPVDGLSSPRDIALVSAINRKAAIMDQLQDIIRETNPTYEIRSSYDNTKTS